MPTIEIVSINAKHIALNQSDFKVAIIEENTGFFAGELINWSFKPKQIVETVPSKIIGNQQLRFQFCDEYKIDIDNILKQAINESQINKIYFLTDYQFGSDNASFEIISTIKDFWILHNQQGLLFNTLYEINSI